MRVIFHDWKAERRFSDLYDRLSEDKQKMFGQMVRDLAKEKIEGDGDEFYVTVKDLKEIYVNDINSK